MGGYIMSMYLFLRDCALSDELKMKRKSWTVKFIILVEYNDAAIANADI